MSMIKMQEFGSRNRTIQKYFNEPGENLSCCIKDSAQSEVGARSLKIPD